MSWAETASESFTARHDERDAAEAERVLAQLEATRRRVQALVGSSLGELSVVLHGSPAQLHLSQPLLLAQRALTGAVGRRYVVGWATDGELHVLSPRALAGRASNVPGSLELLMLAPSALFARRLVFGARSFARWRATPWLVDGAAQYLGGQTPHLRPAVAARLRGGATPTFPPSRRDSAVLAGTLFDLLAREEGEKACVALALSRGAPEKALESAFHGRSLRHTEQAWRHHLERIASAKDGDADGDAQRDEDQRQQHP